METRNFFLAIIAITIIFAVIALGITKISIPPPYGGIIDATKMPLIYTCLAIYLVTLAKILFIYIKR